MTGRGWLAAALIGWLGGLWGAAADGASPLPEPMEILRRALAQPANDPARDRTFDTRHTSVRTRTFELKDGDGKVLRRDEKRQNLGPRNDAATPEDDTVATDAKGKRKRAYQPRDFAVNEELLARFNFTVVGREDYAGRPAWVIDFVPSGGDHPARDLKERFINATAGRVWIDVEESVLARAQFRLAEPVKVWGGLVGSVRRCQSRLERTRTPDGAWYTRLFDWELDGRRLLSQRSMHFHEERTEVRPID